MALHRRAAAVIGIDLVPEGLECARRRGIPTLDLQERGDGLVDAVPALTGGRGPDAVIDAVGMEAHGSRVAAAAQHLTTLWPDALTAADPLGVKYFTTHRLSLTQARRSRPPVVPCP